MATFHRNENGVGYFIITRDELTGYSGDPCPICDECLGRFTDADSITLIPILNEAFCAACASKELSRMGRISDFDQPIAERREKYYADFFNTGLAVE